MFQRKSSKLQCQKKTKKKQEEGRNDKTHLRVLKGFSGLRFLINTYEGLSFQ